tara:strand:+ start:3124 stop:3606 length:483 start_codon:yes stop_codon:yes gene_type:complete
MQIAIIKDNKVESLGELKTLFPNTSFPSQGPNADWYIEQNVMSVTVGLSFDPSVQKQEQTDPYISDGVVYTVKLVDLTDDEKTAYANSQNESLAASQRAERNRRIAETDWMASSDIDMSDAWKEYRQALRDITTHSNFPNLKTLAPDGSGTNDWPVKPEE